ncbi:DDB1- and CUL4-associated factor 6-like [Dendronephthya gigantea]|uniref:DDB1- and CUL4-associated factor 6-like n=1 Tax=Dendronephthya gigantea TaxID=151771 RepID=UPI001069A55E|nr:DDB1- and CUL4-associated factor 6-like [Dendronephthya gigantea]
MNPFHCHRSTTYEVNTTPGDPSTFMSCGSDGTVRLFDLRIKTKCLCNGCKEDVLIDCGKPVTSFCVNPVQPNHVAIGCEKSLLRVYDRRSLSTGEENNEQDKQRGLLYQFRPSALNKEMCKVTSLKYSSDGQNLLASYCTDHVYLFDSNPKSKEFQSESEDDQEGSCADTGSETSLSRLRLRLRGDFSDTGPNSRPEGDGSGLTQPIRGYLSRWIQESRRRRSPLEQQNEPSPVPENIDDIIEDVNDVSENVDDVSEEINDVTDNVDDVSGSMNDVIENTDVTENMNNNMDTSETCEHVRDQQESRDFSCGTSSRGEDNPNNSVSGSQFGDPREITTKTSKIESNVDEINRRTISSENEPLLVTNPGGSLPDQTMDNEVQRLERDTERCDSLGSQLPEMDCEGQNPGVSRNTSSIEKMDDGIPDFSAIESSVNVSPSIDTRVTATSDTDTRGSESPTLNSKSPVAAVETDREDTENHGEPSSSIDENSRRDEAASTIQNFFRFRVKKDFKEIPCKVPLYSDVKQVFKGHRNVRTIIKEANFWGDDYILSGSDCGRIFIWSKKTSEVVMLLEGDRRIVNCVQPHPFLPMLATSGIDYDIKLWTPTALNVCELENTDEVIARNERMLSEGRHTLIVPAAFMIRILSSLRRVRSQAGNDASSE